ncbi:MAG: hypothetical protein GC168_14730 [Candidatus Hydrogenedens sp.]|nr:hypothetical protein [Candidatus Hydrogenedens sp.]
MRQSFRLGVFIVLLCGTAFADDAAAPVEAPAPAEAASPEPVAIDALATDSEIELRVAKAEDEYNQARWFWYVGLNQTYPKIGSEKYINDLFEPLTQAIAPKYDEINTIGDLRDWGLLITPLVGVGRRIGNHLTLSVHGGWAGGSVRTIQDERSIFLGANLHNDFYMYRSAYYADFIIDVHPFGHTKLKDYETWRERFRAARPKISLDVVLTHANYKAVVTLGLTRVIPNIRIELDDAWTLIGLRPHAALEIPYNRNNQLVFTAGYNFFTAQEQDFEGPTFSVVWQHFWKRQTFH